MPQQQIQQEIVKIVKESQLGRVRPHEIVRRLRDTQDAAPDMVKRALAKLMARGELVYTYRDPCSFVETVDSASL